MSYTSTRNTRREARTLVHRFKAGVLAPVLAVPVRGNEGGMLSQTLTYELDPIAGRIITPIFGELVSVFVPVQAMDAAKNPDADYAGVTEVIREKLLSGNPLFVLENEHEISKRLGVNPRSVSGVKKVNEMAKLAHSVAVNFLRRRKYTYAAQIGPNVKVPTPAIIGQTVLDRLNAVLDPDDRINGQVDLQIPDMKLPVSGIGGWHNTKITDTEKTFADATGQVITDVAGANKPKSAQADFNNAEGVKIHFNPETKMAEIFAHLNGAVAGNVSLTDFYNAEKKDRLVRDMRKIVDDNPEYGEEMLLRWASGLSVDTGKMPFVIHEESRMFGRAMHMASDTAGVEDRVQRSDMALSLNFTVPIPRTELGGIIVTFATVKPDETISSQPHPFLSDVWGVDTFVEDELALDPVPVTIRDLDSDCEAAKEANVSCYVGHNQLKANYVSYGLSRQLDPTTVENKTAIWQLDVPLSVSPSNILYPADFSQYPFADQNAEVCTLTITSQAVVQTPMIIGPTPVEALAVIDSNDIFGDE